MRSGFTARFGDTRAVLRWWPRARSWAGLAQVSSITSRCCQSRKHEAGRVHFLSCCRGGDARPSEGPSPPAMKTRHVPTPSLFPSSSQGWNSSLQAFRGLQLAWDQGQPTPSLPGFRKGLLSWVGRERNVGKQPGHGHRPKTIAAEPPSRRDEY